MRYTVKIGICMLVGLVSCNQKNDEAISKITDVLKKDLQNTEFEVTNSIALLETGNNPITNMTNVTEQTTLPVESMMVEEPTIMPTEEMVVVMTPENIPVTTSVPITQEIYRETKSTSPTPLLPSSLYVVQNEVYIKVGDDYSKMNISRHKSQKITVAVFPKNSVTSVDIYLYAVPTRSHIVRNYNTLIGFAKGIEFINGQAQFTRYWRARRADGRLFPAGFYNVYVEYHYRNNKGAIVDTMGRFWGGSHRTWTVRVI